MRLLITLYTLLATALLHAQSISGNLNAGTAMDALGFGNVDIFRGDELVASVLTDRYGNFNVRLDTGTYRCVVSYDGYVTGTRTVHVQADEKVDFAVAKEKGAPAGRPRTTDSRVMSTPTAPMAEDALAERELRRAAPPLPPAFGSRRMPGTGRSGVLTAGEVNDFAKWDQWGDLTQDVLAGLGRLWGMAPAGRHTLDLQTRSGLPIADAAVRLLRKDGTVLYHARTDNTGKAELWTALATGAEAEEDRLRIEVEHQGRTYRVTRAQPFAQAVNRLVLDVPCAPSDLVDVAFVVDGTGSMQDEIDFLKAEMNDIIYQGKRIGDRLNFRFANVFYRDVGAGEEYTTRTMDFTRVLSTAVNFISDQRADGGGDTPEAVEIALDTAINGLAWSAEARARVLFLVLDAGPHLTPHARERMRTLTAQAAAKGIRIVPVAASGIDKATEYLMRTLALGTNGTYAFLTDHSGVGGSHIGPSTDKYDVETLNALLVRILKSYTYMPDCRHELPDLELAYPDSVVALPGAELPADSLSAGVHTDPLPTGPAVRWSYHPNPTTGLLYITADADIAELYLTDLSGKVLQLITGMRAGEVRQVDLSAYATGIYLVRFPLPGGSGADRWSSGKVVVQR